MKSYLKNTIIGLSLFAQNVMADSQNIEKQICQNREVPNFSTRYNDDILQKSNFHNRIFIGYYGRPGIPAMGIVGKMSSQRIVNAIIKKTQEYSVAFDDTNFDFIPAVHLVYGMASSELRSDGTYLCFLEKPLVLKYIDTASQMGVDVILDIQIGNLTPKNSILSSLEYLKYDNVHLAIDPEFLVRNEGVKPGQFIGKITAEEVNEVQKTMSDYMKKNNIYDNKILIVHSFTRHMIKDKWKIKKFDNIDLVINADGHGAGDVKINVFNKIIDNQVVQDKFYTGFKIFFKQDSGTLSPLESLGLKCHNGVILSNTPNYINFQ